MNNHEIIYEAPPTIANFMQSDAFVRIILGPVGSGKSTGCLMEMFRRMCEQRPGMDGIRRTRFAIVRQTLQQIKQTVLKEFYTWIGPVTQFKVSENTIYINFNDVHAEVHLIPLDDEQDQRRLLSMQLTGAWINEFPEIDPGIVPSLCGRLGRYPSAAQGGATWAGLLMDGNFPDEGGPWHNLLEENRPIDWDVWKQPGGMTTHAENLQFLNQTPETMRLAPDDPIRQAQGRKYYERLVRSNSPTWVKRYVHAEYGDDPSGTAVFRDSFKLSFHVTNGVSPVQGHPIVIGQDFGRDPWSIIGQVDHHGRLLILQEVEAIDIGLERHIKENLRPVLMSNQDYLSKPIAMVGDPAGVAKGNIYEETSFDALKRLGFMAFPAPTNDLDSRLRAVEAFLLAQRNGGPAIVIDKTRCPTVIRAFNGGYRYGKTKAGQRKPSPDKNEYSHVMDALQYLCLAAHGGMITTHIAQRLRGRQARKREPIPVGAWT